MSTVFTMSSTMGKNSLGTFMEDTTVQIAVSALVWFLRSQQQQQNALTLHSSPSPPSPTED